MAAEKENAILFGPFIGELGWEVLRFAPHVNWIITQKYKNRKDIKFIVFTREDRFDLYGAYMSIFVPLKIEEGYIQDCFRMINYSIDEYEKLANKFYNKYAQRYNIIEHIYPSIRKNKFANRGQFPRTERSYDFLPRSENMNLLMNYIKEKGNIENGCVVLAPRFRKGLRRNWNNWEQLYDKIYNSEWKDKINFIICGKTPDYIPDNRFLDINEIKLTPGSSTIGLAMEAIKKSYLTVGSQSGIPNLSLLLKTPTLQWGHQKKLHQQTYNVLKTKCIFLEDMKYQISPDEVFDQMQTFLNYRIQKEKNKKNKNPCFSGVIKKYI